MLSQSLARDHMFDVLKTLHLSLVGYLRLHKNDIRALKERQIAKNI